MDALDAVLVAGITGAGAAIDFLLLKRGRKRVQDWLETWFLRFALVEWSNFGRAEAEQAIQILDSYAGAHFWSKQRWIFVSIVSVAAYTGAILYVLLQYVWLASIDGLDLWRLGRELGSGEVWRLVTGAALQAIAQKGLSWFAAGSAGALLLAVLSLALSISFTRLAARVAVNLATSPFRSALVFLLLLLLHIFLLVVWSGVMAALLGLLGSFPKLVIALGHGTSAEMLMKGVAEAVSQMRAILSEEPQNSIYDPWEVFRPLTPGYVAALLDFQIVHSDSYFRYIDVDQLDFLTFQAILNVVANGLRIAFALAFIVSLAFRPLIHAPVLRMWEGLLESNKPFFTTLFGIVAGVFVLGRKLMRVVV